MRGRVTSHNRGPCEPTAPTRRWPCFTSLPRRNPTFPHRRVRLQCPAAVRRASSRITRRIEKASLRDRSPNRLAAHRPQAPASSIGRPLTHRSKSRRPTPVFAPCSKTPRCCSQAGRWIRRAHCLKMASSTTTTRFPRTSSLMRFNFTRTSKSRISCDGCRKLRPT